MWLRQQHCKVKTNSQKAPIQLLSKVATVEAINLSLLDIQLTPMPVWELPPQPSPRLISWANMLNLQLSSYHPSYNPLHFLGCWQTLLALDYSHVGCWQPKHTHQHRAIKPSAGEVSSKLSLWLTAIQPSSFRCQVQSHAQNGTADKNTTSQFCKSSRTW